MPYSKTSELPETAKGLPAKAKRMFLGAFNSAYKAHDGDEERSFKIAWGAVKKKYKKSGGKWIAKAQSAPPITALEAVQATRQLFEAHWAAGGDTKDRDAILEKLAQIEADPADRIEQLRSLNEIAVPALEFTQGYGTWGGGSHENDFPGSLDHRIRIVCRAIYEGAKEYLGPYGYVLAVYPTFAVTCVIDDCCGDEIEYWRVDYSADEGGNVTIGGAEPVEVLTVVIPKGAMGGNSTEDDIASAEKESATLTTTISVDTTGIKKAVQEAIANAKVVSEQAIDFTGTLNEDPQWSTTPDWVTQGQPPPGGDEELVQTSTLQVEQAEVDKATGIMKIQAVLTVGNVLNAMNEVYPTQVWEDNLPFLQAAAKQGSLIGESDHPAPGQASLDRSCILWDEVWMDGDRLMGQGRILPTIPSGQNLQTLLQNKAKVDVSSRGRGTRKKGDWVNPSTGERYQDVSVVQRGFKCAGFDAVGKGASPGATITDHKMAQQTDENLAANEYEEVDVEKLDSLAQQVETLTALVTQMTQNQQAPPAAGAAPPAVPAGTAVLAPAPDQQVQAVIPTSDLSTMAAMATLAERQRRFEPLLIGTRKQELLDEARVQHGMPQQWLNAYRKAFDQGNPQTVEELENIAKSALPIILAQYDKRPRAPGNGIVVQADAGQRPGPQTPEEMIEHLVSDLSDECPFNAFSFAQEDENGNVIQAADWVKTPRRQVRQVLLNVANYKDDHFNGPAALMAYTRLFQGHNPAAVRHDWMKQACADGTTSVAAGGAPASAIFIFPLIRAVYPQLIAGEIASIQPMDRPNGKIFFLNALRIQAGMDVVDQAGDTLSNRQFMDNSSSFSSSYSNRAAECDEAVKIQLRLASMNVDAETKALTTVNTIEELQDLRAYHGLDVNSELMAYASRQIALEWNMTILNEMVAGATAGTLTFNTSNPTGYTQKEWDEYIGRYVGAASNRIFEHRMGEATHLIAGPRAWEKLSAAFRVGTTGMGSNPEMFAGLTLTPFMNGAAMNLRAYKTAFWNGANTDTVLLIRRGADWSDTAYVFAPYVDWVSPILTLPDTFTQKQGIMSRAAHKVVIGNAMSKIVFAAGTGVPL